MKLGAQLYSLREHLKTPADMKAVFDKVKKIGYEVIQFSGAPTKDAEMIKQFADEAGLPIVCTHVPFERIVNETDAVISEHKILGCPVIGLGCFPKENREIETMEEATKLLEEPVKKILASGLKFAYHNHAHEFALCNGRPYFDKMLEEHPDWQFIMDTYWVEKAGYSAIDYIRKIGGQRLPNIHFKDMADNEDKSICACGNGTLNFAAIKAVCDEVGVENVLVEQDNAKDFGDDVAQMAFSFCTLRNLFEK